MTIMTQRKDPKAWFPWFGVVATGALSLLASTPCAGHDQTVHVGISKSAARSSAGLQLFLTDNLGAASAPFLSTPPLDAGPGANFPNLRLAPVEWIQVGSNDEDNESRFLNHFYTLDVRNTPKS